MNPFETQAQLVTEARQRGDRTAEATALADLGLMHLRSGDAARAAGILAEAADLARMLNDSLRLADAEGNLGLALLEMGRAAEAHTHCESALAAARASGSGFAEKMALEQLGVIAARGNDPRTALIHFGSAVELARQLGDWQHEAELHWFRAIQYAELDDRAAAMGEGQGTIDCLANRDESRAAIYRDHLAKYRRGQSLAPVFPGGLSFSSLDRTAEVPEPAGPGLLHMALSAAQALGKFLGSGMKTATAEVRQRRLELCTNCENHTGMRCRLCGCFTDLKTRLPHEACPAGRW